MFREVGKTAYFQAITDYVAQELNNYVEQMRKIGKQEAANQSDKVLANFNKKHSIAKTFGSQDESVKAYADEIKEMLQQFGRNPALNMSNMAFELQQQLKGNFIIGNHAKYGKVLLLQSASKFVKTWLSNRVDDSQKKSMHMKSRLICNLIDLDGEFNKPKRVNSELKKGILVQINERVFCFL